MTGHKRHICVTEAAKKNLVWRRVKIFFPINKCMNTKNERNSEFSFFLNFKNIKSNRIFNKISTFKIHPFF